jgi:hypothetical protein
VSCRVACTRRVEPLLLLVGRERLGAREGPDS